MADNIEFGSDEWCAEIEQLARPVSSEARQVSTEARQVSSEARPVSSEARSVSTEAPRAVHPKTKERRRSKYKQKPESKQKQHSFAETTNRIGFNSGEHCSPIEDGESKSKTGGELFKPGTLSFLFGVLLPLLAVLAETNTHWMAKTFFDPFPTSAHILLFLLIPVSNSLSWLAVRTNLVPLYSTMSLSSGMALGIAILYSVMILPHATAFATMGPSVIGALGLAPLLAIPVTLLCGQTVCQLATRQKTFFDAHQLKHLGHLIVLVMVISVELPSTLTRFYLSRTDNAETEAESIQWLRKWGDKDVLLRACYERSGNATDILGTLAETAHPIGIDKARTVYYKVTGVPFNSVQIPASFRGTIKNAGLVSDPAGLNDDVKDEFDLDPDIAGELISGVARGLSVSNSTISGTLDTAYGIGSLDWDFTFENVSEIPREARAKILLPPNAVVTRATIWLDDWQRDTVIQERGLARATYQSAVENHKRDPLLVSMAGKDSVLVQCYPVVKGQKSKVRLHIATPLVVASNHEESLLLPTFEERNFAITVPHKLQLQSKQQFAFSQSDGTSGANLTNANLSGSSNKLAMDVDNAILSRFDGQIRIKTDSPASQDSTASKESKESSAPDNPNDPNTRLELTIRPPESHTEARQAFYTHLPEQDLNRTSYASRPASNRSNNDKKKKLTVVIDKSITMAPYISEIVNGLKTAPADLNVSVVNVGDEFDYLCDESEPGSSEYTNALARVAELKCEGGRSGACALENVFARSEAPGAVLWIHAAQPLANSPTPTMKGRLLTSRSPLLYDLQVASGPNTILANSYDYPGLDRVVRSGSLSHDVADFLDNYAEGRIKRCATTFGVRTAGNAPPEVAQVQAFKLALARYQHHDRSGAYELAKRYQLVTPVSSAVVTDEAPNIDELQTRYAKAPNPVSEILFNKKGKTLHERVFLPKRASEKHGADTWNYSRRAKALDVKTDVPQYETKAENQKEARQYETKARRYEAQQQYEINARLSASKETAFGDREADADLATMGGSPTTIGSASKNEIAESLMKGLGPLDETTRQSNTFHNPGAPILSGATNGTMPMEGAGSYPPLSAKDIGAFATAGASREMSPSSPAVPPHSVTSMPPPHVVLLILVCILFTAAGLCTTIIKAITAKRD